MTRNLGRLLRPKSIAVIGGGTWCANVIRECQKIGFDGPIWPVHPGKTEIGGLPCVAHIDDLPAPPDASFVGVNRTATCDVVASLSAQGAGGAVCFASGFREAVGELVDGATLQDRLLGAAGDMPIFGPNCYGLINALDSAALWPDHHGLVPVERGVALITQSSNIALNLTMQRRGLPIAYLLTAGNQAQIDLAEIGMAVLADDRVTALGLHIEGIQDLRALEHLAAEAQRLGKPILALKVGASDQARAATISHTASLAGSDAGARVLFARLGIGQVDSLTVLLETLKICHAIGPLPSNRIATMSCSGGEASLIADTALGADVIFPPLTQAQITNLRAALGPKVALANPLDYHTYVWADRAGMARCFEAMKDPDLALACVVLDYPRGDRCAAPEWDLVLEAMIDTNQTGGTRLALLASMSENMPEPVAQRAMAQGIVPLEGFSDALRAIAVAARLGQVAAKADPILKPTPEGPARLLPEAEAKSALSAQGLAIPQSARATRLSDIPGAVANLNFPVALKAEGLAHKTEAGGVVLGLNALPDLLAAAEAMPASQFLIEEMAPKAVAELLIGVLSDPAHGMVLTLGAGGTLTELWRDTTSLLLPVTAAEIEVALNTLRITPLLDGYRGAPAANRKAIVQAVLAVQDYVIAHPQQVQEVEVNPLICTPDTAIAVDALIRLKEPT